MSPAPDRRAAITITARATSFAWALLAGFAAAQQPGQAQQPGNTSSIFTAPDGSRFVLAPDPSMPLVHWAVATLADDPPRHPGLSLALVRASLSGTWLTGSVDAAQERRALDEQDQAWHAWSATPADPALAERLVTCTRAAEQLGDRFAFRRVLAAAPAHHPQVQDRHPACLFVLTSVPEALGGIAQIMVERREHAALRDLLVVWPEAVYARGVAQLADPSTAVLAEVLALAIPDHPYGRLLERPDTSMPQREEAMATWQATQRPERTVHALVGGFDPDAVTTMLQQAFATTALPPAPLPAVVVPRPITSLRRSVVQGVPTATVAVAFVLPPNADRTLLAVGARWLGGGPDSALGQALQKLDRKSATVRARAPWPPGLGGDGLLLVEVEDRTGVDQLGDQILQACRKAAAVAPTPASLQPVLTALQRERTELTNEPRELAAALAEAALVRPKQPMTPPERVQPKAVQELLARIVTGQPVIVEGRP